MTPSISATEPFDVAVIGAGVVGCAIARELSGYRLRLALVDAASDVGSGTSKANTAILHTGFDATPGSLEACLVARGYAKLKAYAAEAGIPVEETGALLVAWTEEQASLLPGIREKAARNGVTDLVPLTRDEVYRREPHLGPGALAGLLIPGEGIVCPYTPPIAYATQALANGCAIYLNSTVVSISEREGTHVLRLADERRVPARWVVNAAGLNGDAIDAMMGFHRFSVRPRRGQLIVFDKLARAYVRHVLLPVPTKTTKGVLVSPTVFGNVLLGPTAEDLDDKTDTSTTAPGLEALWEKGKAILPALAGEEVTASYAGLRAATGSSDYQIHRDPARRYVCVGGIRSTGLTASLGIAEYVAESLLDAGLELEPKADLVPVRMPYLGSDRPRPSEVAEAIALNPDYGRVVCHCERVSRGEIVDALTSLLPAPHLDGLRRRTRCLQGRCQGFYCLASVVGIVSEVTGLKASAILEGSA